MKITLHQLKVFEMVALQRSVTMAAHHLHMTQPAVSNIIKQLEAYYGCPLIEIIGRKLYLTAFGTALFSTCHDIQNILNNTQAEIELLKGGLSGTLHVASVSTAKYFIPHLLGQFKQEHPDIHIKLTVGNRQEVITRLKENLDDFVIMSHPPTTTPVDCADFYDDELIVATGIHYMKTKKQPVALKSLEEEPWIIRELGSGTRYATQQIFKKYRFNPKVEMEIGDNEAIKQTIISNMGITILSKRSIELELKNKLIKALPVKGFPVKHKWYLVKNRGKSLSPIAENFFSFTQDM